MVTMTVAAYAKAITRFIRAMVKEEYENPC